MFESHVVTSEDELRFSIWRFPEQFVFVNNYLLCYWPTIFNSISKICPEFQFIGSRFFEVDELLDEQWAKIVRSENISTPIYVDCDKMCRSKVCVQKFWYCVPGLDIQPELSEIDNPARRKAVAGYGTLQVIWRVIYHFFQHCIFFSTIFTLSLHPPNPEP